MSCPGEYYTASDYTIAFGTLTGFTLADVKDLSVKLCLEQNELIFVTKTYLGGTVQIVGGVMSFILTEADITAPGRYALVITLTDQSDNTTRLTPCPKYLDFKN